MSAGPRPRNGPNSPRAHEGWTAGVGPEGRYLRPTALTQGPVSVEVWVAAARPYA
jgi:hypothetical protein